MGKQMPFIPYKDTKKSRIHQTIEAIFYFTTLFKVALYLLYIKYYFLII